MGCKKEFTQDIEMLLKELIIDREQKRFCTNQFPVERGLAPGNPISCMLFILACNVIEQLLKNDNVIGYETQPNKAILTSQYVDDLTLFLNGTADNIKRAE